MANVESHTIPPDLQAGLRALQDVPGFSLNGSWRRQGNVLVNDCTVTLNAGSEFIDAVTHWNIITTDEYPRGPLAIVRAPDSGVRGAFPHELKKDMPCLITRAQPLGRWDDDPEPMDAFLRLEWHAVRLVRWVERAAQGTLLNPGDAFGHPLIDTTDGTISINTFEDSASLNVWRPYFGRSGRLQLRLDPLRHLSMYAVEFTCGGELVQHPRWGAWVTALTDAQTGLWCLLQHPPFTRPWGFPVTWSELRESFRVQGMSLDDLIRRVIVQGDAVVPFLFIGYPVSSVVNGPEVKIEWQACKLPVHSSLVPDRKGRGFRNLPKSWWLKARRHYLCDGQGITWINSQNHQPSELGSRGFLPEEIQTKRVTLIGGGALGSAIAEHLVRTGVTDITIIDKDSIQNRNLVRHTLTLADVPQQKAVQLAKRLGAINTLVQPVGYAESFPPSTEAAKKAVELADVIIDTTGDNQVLADLGQLRWLTPKDIINLSLGWRAMALYAYAERTTRFNAYAYRKAVGPHIAHDLNSKADEVPPMEGIGCWNPVWPALHTDVQLLAAAGAKFIRNFLEGEELTRLRVYEQLEGDAGFEGIKIRSGLEA